MVYTSANPALENESIVDKAIFTDLHRNISENYAHLAREWEYGSISEVSNEAMEASVSLDATSFRSVRYLPFDIWTISDTIWRLVQTGFVSGSLNTVGGISRTTTADAMELIANRIYYWLDFPP